MKLQFLGAAGTVTGSKYLLESGGKKILIDCGLFQGRKMLRLRNWDIPPFNPADIDAVLLTHAHIDHSGYLPLLVKNGFKGKIYCSEATRDLCAILLPDSGYLQEEDAERANRYHYTKHHPAMPLYTEADARDALEFFHPVDFGTETWLDDELRFTLHHAGHILGASFIKVMDDNTSILFSGDLGRPHDAVIIPPAHIQQADYLVVESTYGDRAHEKTDPLKTIGHLVNKTIKRGGTLVCPAFAVGRAQSLIYYLHVLKQTNKIPDIPVYLDSPMAINVTELLHKHKSEHRLSPAVCRAMCDMVIYTRKREESKAINEHHMPCVIISASGMATGGRVLHHLKHTLGDERNTILLAGFQAAETRGDRLVRGETEIKIHGEMYPVRAEIQYMRSVSAHADYNEMLEWLEGFNAAPRQVFIVHGEEHAAASLKKKITDKFGWDAHIPEHLETVEF